MALLPLAAALLASVPGPNALSPDGPATLREVYLGPTPLMPYRYEPPRVVVAWSLHVSEGGNGGPVTPVIMRGWDEGPVRVRGRTEMLPAAGGIHTFPAQLPLPQGTRLAVEQEVGGHAILYQHPQGDRPYSYYAVDVWKPPLADGVPARYSERRKGQQLSLAATTELDVDGDGYGDATQDANDLAIGARAGRRRVRVRLRNRGTRPVARPRVLVRMRGAELRNPSKRSWFLKAPPPGFQMVKVRSIPVGETRSVVLRASRAGFRAELIAGSEGFDPTPSSMVVRGRSG